MHAISRELDHHLLKTLLNKNILWSGVSYDKRCVFNMFLDICVCYCVCVFLLLMRLAPLPKEQQSSATVPDSPCHKHRDGSSEFVCLCVCRVSVFTVEHRLHVSSQIFSCLLAHTVIRTRRTPLQILYAVCTCEHTCLQFVLIINLCSFFFSLFT